MSDPLDLKTRIIGLLDELIARSEPGRAAASAGDWAPRVDMYDLPDRIVLRADVPGIPASDLEVRLEGRELVLRGTRRPPEDIPAEHLCRLERPFGTFVRRYQLPDTVDPDAMRASCRLGVLEVTIRKREPSETRRISVETN